MTYLQERERREFKISEGEYKPTIHAATYPTDRKIGPDELLCPARFDFSPKSKRWGSL